LKTLIKDSCSRTQISAHTVHLYQCNITIHYAATKVSTSGYEQFIGGSEAITNYI